MVPEEDMVVDISVPMQRFFGCSGKMLKPSVRTVANLLREIPEGRLITFESLRKELARRFEVQVTCPSDTKQALKQIANSTDTRAAFWRVVRRNGELIPYFPGGVEAHSALLQEEGFAIEEGEKVRRVKNFKQTLTFN